MTDRKTRNTSTRKLSKSMSRVVKQKSALKSTLHQLNQQGRKKKATTKHRKGLTKKLMSNKRKSPPTRRTTRKDDAQSTASRKARTKSAKTKKSRVLKLQKGVTPKKALMQSRSTIRRGKSPNANYRIRIPKHTNARAFARQDYQLVPLKYNLSPRKNNPSISISLSPLPSQISSASEESKPFSSRSHKPSAAYEIICDGNKCVRKPLSMGAMHCDGQKCMIGTKTVVGESHVRSWGPGNSIRNRQYEHIKQSEMERGKPESVASRIAAATVNRTRKLHGETKN